MAGIDYGIDAPESVSNCFWRAGTCAVLGIGIYFMNRKELPGPGMILMAIFVAIALGFLALGIYLRWSSQNGKLSLRDQILDKIRWSGDEKVLDAGCGRGLLAVGAAKRLKKGRVTGVDIWNPNSLSGNKAEAAMANAKEESVADRVKFETGDVRQLTYGDNSFDVVLSASTLHELHDAQEREEALREMWRVLKPGGSIAIFDVFHAGEYAGLLKAAGASQVEVGPRTWLWAVPGRIVTARK